MTGSMINVMIQSEITVDNIAGNPLTFEIIRQLTFKAIIPNMGCRDTL